jgi:hypothetical protein
MFHSPIIRLTAGCINQINDAVIGGISGVSGQSKYPQQLGNGIWLDDNNILFNSAVGTVYGGHFRYVRLAAAAAAVVVGQLVFWDTVANAADNLYQVTTAESGTTDAACSRAGIVLNNGWTPGNYSVIQDCGPVYCKFRAALTSAGAIGSACYAAAAGGADLGFLDVLDSAAQTSVQDVALMQRRWIGEAIDAPTNSGLKRVYVNFMNLRG